MSIINDLYPNFDLACAACGTGYDNQHIASVVAYKTCAPFHADQAVPEQALNSILAVSMAASELERRPLRILDFGGGCGFHFFRIVAALKVALRWAIVETPSMAEKATEIAGGRYSAHETIDDALDALGGLVDLVHTSGALQYMSDPPGTLRELVALDAPFMVLARLPIWQGAETVGIQASRLSDNGIGPLPPGVEDRIVRYPVSFTPFTEVSSLLSDYKLVLKMASPSADYEVEGQKASGSTLIYRRRD